MPVLYGIVALCKFAFHNNSVNDSIVPTVVNLQERDWAVLQMVLEKLTLILENKTLVLTADSHFIDALCGKLCAMVCETSPPLLNHPIYFNVIMQFDVVS